MDKTPYNISPDAHTPLPIDFYVNGLRITSRTNFWQWTRNGLKTLRKGGRVFVTQADLQAFLSQNPNTKPKGGCNAG